MNRLFAFPAGYLAAVSVRSGLGWSLRSLNFGASAGLLGLLVVGIAAFLGGAVLAMVWRGSKASTLRLGLSEAGLSYVPLLGGLLGAFLFSLERLTSATPAWSLIELGNGLVTLLAAAVGAWVVQSRFRAHG